MLSKAVLLGIGALALAAGCRNKDTHAHDHAHAHPEHAASSVPRSDGKKWATDAPLRTGMAAIRSELQSAMKPIHENTYSAEQYKALANKIDAQIATIVAECKLPPDADAELHTVLSQLAAGTDLMKKAGSGMAGAIRTFQGLETYARSFDHPGWKPLEH